MRVILKGGGVLPQDRQMDGQNNEQMDICDSRVAFATEKLLFVKNMMKDLKEAKKTAQGNIANCS